MWHVRPVFPLTRFYRRFIEPTVPLYLAYIYLGCVIMCIKLYEAIPSIYDACVYDYALYLDLRLRCRPHNLSELLYLACVNGSCDVVRVLLARGADPSASWFGVPPLHAAIRAGSCDVCAELLDRGADPEALYGARSPVETAVLCGAADICALLAARGARVTPEHAKCALRLGDRAVCRALLTQARAIRCMWYQQRLREVLRRAEAPSTRWGAFHGFRAEVSALLLLWVSGLLLGINLFIALVVGMHAIRGEPLPRYL